MSARALAALCLMLTACTLRALSNEIVQEQCRIHQDCRVLNDSNTVFDVCHPFQCLGGYCQRGLLDADQDGFPDRTCEPNTERQDCNDQLGQDYPGAPEACDSRDNDCDRRVDEGVLELSQSPVVMLSSDQVASRLAYAADLELEKLSLAFTLAPDPSSVFVKLIDTSMMRDGVIVELQLPAPSFMQAPERFTASSLALADLPNTTVALAAFTRTGLPRLLIGSVDWPDSELFLNAGVSATGVRCEALESCASQPLPPAAALPTPESRSLALANGRDGALLAYRRAQVASPACSATRTPAPILANLFSPGAGGLYERSAQATTVATTEDDSPAALLALPATTGNDVLHGFLLAYASSDGQLLIHHVDVKASGLEFSSPMLELRADEGTLSAPRLALGDREMPLQTRIGLIAERGCGADRRLVFKQLMAALGDDGSVQLTDKSPWLTLGEAADQRAGALTWDPNHLTWGVSYRDDEGLRARVIGADLKLWGERSYVLNGPAPMPLGAAETTEILPLKHRRDWYMVFAQRPGEITRHVLRSCTGVVLINADGSRP